jgi:hypothetical protein
VTGTTQARWNTGPSRASDGARRSSGNVILAFVAVLAAAAGILAGCGWWSDDVPAGVTPEQVVGSWRSDKGGTIRFESDGTFTATELRNEVFNAQGRGGERHAGSGRWELTPPIDQPDGPKVRVALRFEATAQHPLGYLNEMRAEHTGDRDDVILLVFYVSGQDLNGRYVFQR